MDSWENASLESLLYPSFEKSVFVVSEANSMLIAGDTSATVSED